MFQALSISLSAFLLCTMANPSTWSEEVLASNHVFATYAGTQARRCMFMTSMCPDNCNHPRKWHLFNVDEYVHYSKPGQYGDEQTKQFALQLEPIETKTGHSKGTYELASQLQPGDKVELVWDHIYVTDNGSKYPIRRVKQLQRK